MELIDKVARTIREEALFPAGERILCAVSGGADSTALLLILHELAPSMGLRLACAHVNHCLRGDESDRDEAFVRELCSRLDIPLYVRRADVARLAASSGRGLEACARDVRYAFFLECLRAHGIKYLATAHTARDNLETALFHLTRGTGVAGLAGIPVSRALGDYTVVRPLIAASRDEIEAYLSARGEEYVTDSTNAEDEYARNRIRHRVLPALESMNPSLYETAAATQRGLRRDADFVERAADAAYREIVKDASCDCAALRALHPAVSGRLVMRLYRETAPDGAQLTAANCEAVLALAESKNPSARAVLPSGVTVYREYERLVFSRERPGAALIERPLFPGRSTGFPEAGIEIVCEKGQGSAAVSGSIHNFFLDYARVCGILTARARREGDAIRLVGHKHEKSLKKAMIDAKIPRYRRALVPVICDEEGILAVGGLGAAARAAVTEETREILTIQIINIAGGQENDDCRR